MSNRLKSIIKLITPSFLIIFYRSNLISIKKHGGFYGRYNAWEEAQQKAEGYDAEHILNQVANATQEVINDPNRFERDGVIINQREYSYPALAYLAKWGLSHSSISVLDLGGSLGSVYYQFKKFFPSIKQITWAVVEQPHFVKKGKEQFLSEELYFYDSIEEAVQHKKPNVAFLSSVLQYFPSPYQWLEKINQTKIPYLIIDRIPVFNGSKDRITLQYVSKQICRSSYPAWIFSKSALLNFLSTDYSIIHEFPALDGKIYLGASEVEFKGFILERKV